MTAADDHFAVGEFYAVANDEGSGSQMSARGMAGNSGWREGKIKGLSLRDA
jgi:hypothetical protein